jgi:acyl-coenzyme A synthetase/AMP-(fatty) acid ligase
MITTDAAPDGSTLLGWLANDAQTRHRVISDGYHSISYADTTRLLRDVDAHFSRCGVTTERPIALECSQSVAGAVALLHLLSRKYSVVLLPDPASRSKEAGIPRFIPSFCAHVITASPEKRSGAFSAENGLVCGANPAFTRDAVIDTFTGSDLYLRTSGSTGNPKLTRMSHQKWLNNAMACVERWTLTSDDRLAIPVPIFHSYGFGAAFLPGLLVGAAMDLIADGNIVSYLEREARFTPNVAFLTPATCDIFLTRRKSPRTYRFVVTAGDRVKRETMAGFEDRFGPLLNLYGSAEMGAVSAASPTTPPDSRIGTAGYPLTGIELRTDDAGVDGEVAAEDGVGILHCRQMNGTAGYLIHDGQWRFEPHEESAWFDMRDLARVRTDGFVEILGRSGLSVKRDGLLVVFADVESALEKVEGVQRAVVLASGETLRGTRLIGFCVADGNGHALQPEAVRRTCFELLPRYAVPDEVVIVDSLPQLPSGKINRPALRKLIDTSSSPSAARA